MSSAYIRVKEVIGQVPGTTCNRARTNSAINNKQASSYIRAEREWLAGTTASSAKGGRPTRTPNLAYWSRTWPISQVALAYRRYRGSTKW